eukprot:7381521-Prymnesium_polylepis.1
MRGRLCRCVATAGHVSAASERPLDRAGRRADASGRGGGWRCVDRRVEGWRVVSGRVGGWRRYWLVGVCGWDAATTWPPCLRGSRGAEWVALMRVPCGALRVPCVVLRASLLCAPLRVVKADLTSVKSSLPRLEEVWAAAAAGTVGRQSRLARRVSGGGVRFGARRESRTRSGAPSERWRGGRRWLPSCLSALARWRRDRAALRGSSCVARAARAPPAGRVRWANGLTFGWQGRSLEGASCHEKQGRRREEGGRVGGGVVSAPGAAAGGGAEVRAAATCPAVDLLEERLPRSRVKLPCCPLPSARRARRVSDGEALRRTLRASRCVRRALRASLGAAACTRPRAEASASTKSLGQVFDLRFRGATYLWPVSVRGSRLDGRSLTGVSEGRHLSGGRPSAVSELSPVSRNQATIDPRPVRVAYDGVAMADGKRWVVAGREAARCAVWRVQSHAVRRRSSERSLLADGLAGLVVRWHATGTVRQPSI